jgi:FkbM family methyltransferase
MRARSAGLGWGILRSLVIYLRPGRQRGLQRLYAPFVKSGDLVFDIGAHVGDRSRAFLGLGARVVAVEPQPQLHPWLARTLGGNPRAQILPEAVGAQPGRAELAISRRNPTVSTLSEAWRSRLPEVHPGFRGVRWEDRVEVEVTTLDRMIERFGVPAFCKIDVEGYEEEVLKGLSQEIPALSFEFVAGGLDLASACVQRLEAIGGYEFNSIPGEKRRFHHPAWISGVAMRAWLSEGAEGFSSGDLYARTPR